VIAVENDNDLETGIGRFIDAIFHRPAHGDQAPGNRSV
jgi:hypothetical protein